MESDLNQITSKVGALGFEPRSAGIFYSRDWLTALSGCDGSALQSFFIDICIPTRRHSRATGARGTAKLYYTPFGEAGDRPALFQTNGWNM